MSVYLISDNRDRVKIGFAVDPAKRLIMLQTGNADRLSIIRLIDGGWRTESWMHREFRQFRIREEWFNFVEPMLTVQPPAEPVVEKVQAAVFPRNPNAIRDYIRDADRLGLLKSEDRAAWAPFLQGAEKQ